MKPLSWLESQQQQSKRTLLEQVAKSLASGIFEVNR